MKFVITGSGGQLGREWVQFLTQKQLSFRGFGSGELDITKPDVLNRTFEEEKPDVVINCAAYTAVDRAEREPEKAFLVNETGVRNIAECCRVYGAKMIHYSTDYVFPGQVEDRVKYPKGYPEEAEIGPLGVYGRSKRAGEEALIDSHDEWLLFRISWLCGQYGSNFVKTMLRLGKEKETVRVVDDQTGSPSYAFDVVEKSFDLIRKRRKGIYHISSGGPVTWAGFAEQIFKEAGTGTTVIKIRSSEFPTDAKRPAYSFLATNKIVREGLPVTDWKEGLPVLIRQIENEDGPGKEN